MKPSEFKYYKVRTKTSTAEFEFTSLQDFYRYVTEHHLKTILMLLNEQQEATHFAVSSQGALMTQATCAFESLEDYVSSRERHFPDAESYYDAKQKGYAEYKDYELVKTTGIADKLVFEKMKAGGFIEGHAVFAAWQKENPEGPAREKFEHAYALYEYAKGKGFEDFARFRKACENGFEDAATQNVATELGFTLAADYEEAKKRDAHNMEDLKFMREHQLRNKEDAQRFIDLTFLSKTGCKHDECVLLTILSKLDVGKKISINKLREHYEKALEDYRYTDNLQLPPWFTTAFKEKEDMVLFLSKNEAVKKYGHYDSDGEFFETNRVQERKVVIDGSNVAYNSAGNGKAEAKLSNIIAMVVFLKHKGFTEISVINDASLKHRVSDKNNLNDLKKMTEVTEAPAENAADVFIIQYVKRNHCLLVSNDTFREWKTKDPWVAENIDFYRLSFLIKDSQVLMPDLEVGA